jgi:hypothetical protein
VKGQHHVRQMNNVFYFLLSLSPPLSGVFPEETNKMYKTEEEKSRENLGKSQTVESHQIFNGLSGWKKC